VKFVVDMNLSPEWSLVLRARGYEAMHWRDIGHAAASDDTILEWATEHGRAILTGDLDFASAVTMRGLKVPSVVQLRIENTDPVDSGERVIGAINAWASDLERGAIVTIDPDGVRIRLLDDE
jgi:predicted nuclease of predicted toxin-antitoxin system